MNKVSNKLIVRWPSALAAYKEPFINNLTLFITFLFAPGKPGDRVMVPPNIPEEEARMIFPDGVYTKELPSGKKYLRYTPQP